MVTTRREKSVSVRIFKGANDPDLPPEIKSMSPGVRRSWISSYNYYVTAYGDGDSALAYAYENTYIPLSDVLGSKAAGEKPDSSGEPIPDESQEEVSEKTDQQKEDSEGQQRDTKPKKEPPGAVASKSFFQTLVEGVKSVVGVSADVKAGKASTSALTIYKQADGTLRAFMVYSNVFKDKHKEILSEAAHKEYVEWVEKTGAYPEFQLWHGGPGTRWGKADFVDFVDGFAIASGPVDKDKEYIAEALQKRKDRVSHGFYGLKAKDASYLIYRPFELSPLPPDEAANYWTGVSIGSKEFTMPFSTAKKAYLKTVGMSDEDITAAETSLKSMGDTLKEAGIDWKEANSVEDSASSSAGGVGIDANAIIVGELKSLTGAMTQLAQVVVKQQKDLGEAQAKLTALETESKKSIDTRVEDALTARVATAGGAGGFRASEDSSTVISKEAGEAAAAAAGDDNWFAQMIDGQFNSILGGAGATGANKT